MKVRISCFFKMVAKWIYRSINQGSYFCSLCCSNLTSACINGSNIFSCTSKSCLCPVWYWIFNLCLWLPEFEETQDLQEFNSTSHFVVAHHWIWCFCRSSTKSSLFFQRKLWDPQGCSHNVWCVWKQMLSTDTMWFNDVFKIFQKVEWVSRNIMLFEFPRYSYISQTQFSCSSWN